MKQKWLFGADVNKIQDTVFRASLQRQVVGGSYLLREFGEQAAQLAAEHGGRTLVKAGGNFRIVFDEAGRARDFGRILANTYHQLLNGVISVAEPAAFVEHDHNAFACANKTIFEEIAARKSARAALSMAHAPTTAYCQSSGVGLAGNYESLIYGENGKPTDEEEQYLSSIASAQACSGNETKKKRNRFLNDIADLLPNLYQDWAWISTAEQAAHFDASNGNVAYLVADGNNMGLLFRACATPDELKALSDTLQDVVEQATAAALPQLIEALQKEFPKMKQEIPILPLILAGDDIFIMLPAPFALDYARQFCVSFETEMAKSHIVKQLRKRFDVPCSDVQLEEPIPNPTMAAAIVFCKRNYPYRLAHERGEALLGQTKRVIKSVGAATGDWYSAESFTLIVGSELVGQQSADEGSYRPKLTTYWTGADVSSAAGVAALSIDTIFDARRKLENNLDRLIPRKRLNELREIFDDPPENDGASRANWLKKLNGFYDRVRATEQENQQYKLLTDVLAQLAGEGEDDRDGWGRFVRSDQEFQGTALLDLLAAWQYSLPLGDTQ